MIAAVVAVVGGVLAALATSQPADHADEFYAAVALEEDGRVAEAAGALEALVAAAPTDRFADDALAELGQLYEEKLGEPEKALAAWERLAHDFPDSRLALRAEKRAAALRAGLGSDGGGAAALGRLEKLVYGYDPRRRAETIAALEALVAEYPRAPATPRALVWLGQLLVEDGRIDEGVARLRAASAGWPGSEWAARAIGAEADALLDDGDIEGAAAAFARLEGEARADGLARAARARTTRRTVWLAWGFLAAALVLALVAGRGRVRPPMEVWYLAPIAALLVGGAFLSQDTPIARAVAMVAGGGLAVAWLSGAALDAARARLGRVTLRRALLHGAVAAAAVAAVCYLAVTKEKLVDQAVETLRFGPD